MKKKIYSSYDEIDRDLEILDLERKLHYQKVKLSVEDLKKNLTLPNLAGGLLGISGGNTGDPLIKRVFPLAKTAFRISLPFLVKKAFGWFSR